jgi:DNA-directed RNA polymerase specialized sigma24 family protein
MDLDSTQLEEGRSREAVFHALIRAHYREVVRYCVRRLGSEGEEIAQEVFAIAWQAWAKPHSTEFSGGPMGLGW